VLHLGMSWGAALVVAAPAAAQQYKSDRDLLTHQTCTELSSEDCSRLGRLKEGEARQQANKQARRNKLLRLPPLPDERNVLLGSWRLEDAARGGGDTGFGQKKGAGGADAMLRELWTTLESNPDKLFCNPMMFGHGITFASSSYSIQALDGSVSRSSIDYRNTEKQVIVAIPGNMEMELHFQIEGPNRILFRGSCALVRVGAPVANAAAIRATAPGNARTGAANSSVPPTAGAPSQAAAIAAPSAAPATPALPPIAYAPVDPRSALGRGIALYRGKDFQPALQQFLAATAANPNDARGWVFLADTYRWLGLERDGESALARALRLDPNATNLLR
jgi:hypothetical protein